MDEVPLPESGILKGVIYRVRGPRTEPKRELAPEVLEVIRRGEQKLIREYLEKKKRAS
ncbi:MAG TPA: hypothetical protein VIG93_02315 [Gaiellaceae bacterium]